MTNILFVCHGNICRSPMAEFIMKKEIEERGIAASFEVASAGTSDEEEGNPVYPPARAELSRRGIDCSGKRARKISRADCAHYDYILCMEDWHVRSVLRLCGEKEKGKVHRLSDYTDRPHDIADPWYTRDFAAAYGDIRAGVTAFLDSLQEKTSHT